MCAASDVLGVAQLLTSVRDGSVEEVEDLLKKRTEGSVPDFLNQTDDTNRTPLSVACELKRGDVVDLLLKYGSNPNSSTEPNGKTVLCYSCDHEEWNAGIVRQLLHAGARVDQQMTDGQTALHIASFRGNVEVVSLLLAHYADVNILDSHRENALCKTKSAVVAKLLIDAGSDVDSCFGKPILRAVKNGRFDIAALLVKSGSNLNYDPLMQIACREGFLGVMKVLVNGGITVKSFPHLSVAVESSKCTTEAVKYLITAGCSVNSVIGSDKWRAIHQACSIVSVPKVQLLLDCGAQVSGNPFPSLFNAIPTVRRRFWFDVGRRSKDVYLSDMIVLMKLLHAAGARIDQSDVDAFEKDFSESDADDPLKQRVMDLLYSYLRQPRRLDDICRVAVRYYTPADKDHHIQQLPLPATFKSFLTFDDILE